MTPNQKLNDLHHKSHLKVVAQTQKIGSLQNRVIACERTKWIQTFQFIALLRTPSLNGNNIVSLWIQLQRSTLLVVMVKSQRQRHNIRPKEETMVHLKVCLELIKYGELRSCHIFSGSYEALMGCDCE